MISPLLKVATKVSRENHFWAIAYWITTMRFREAFQEYLVKILSWRRELDGFEEPPGPRVSVEYLGSVEPVIEESVREGSAQNEYVRDIFLGALSEQNPTTAQPNSARPDESTSTDIVSRPIRVARNWSDKVPKHTIPKFDKQLTVNMRASLIKHRL